MAAPMRPYCLLPARCRSYYRLIRELRTTCSASGKNDEGVSLEANPFYSKYSNKIKELRRTNPEQVQSLLQKPMKSDVNKKKEFERLQVAKEGKPSRTASPICKTLDSVMKVELTHDKTKEEIIQIWKEHHSKKDMISAAIPSETYKKIHERSVKYPMFLYPMPRQEGYEFIIAQFDANNCHFTSLINYQAYAENAPVLLTMVHYTELQQTKGIVLMHGEHDTKTLKVQEAQFLANQLQMYYGSDSVTKQQLLETFTKQPDKFNHMDLIKEMELTELPLTNSL